MIATAPSWIVDAGITAGAVGAVVALGALVAKAPPTRWIASRLVTDPFKVWFHTAVRAEVTGVLDCKMRPMNAKVERIEEIVGRELNPNGGTSMRDEVGALSGQIAKVDVKVDAIEARVDRIETQLPTK